MSTVSYNRVVDVSVAISDQFPTVANFSIPLLLDPDTAVDTTLATDLVQSFSDLASLELYGFPTTSPVYIAAQKMLATANAPRTFKVGHLNATDILSSLTAIAAVDNLWYTVVMVPAQLPADSADLIAANDFLIDNSKILMFETDDSALKASAADATGLGALLRAVQPSRLIGFHSEGTEGYAVKAASYVSAVNYNNPAAHYTLKFKRLDGALPTDLNDGEVQNLTGFLPGTGQDPAAGGFLNAYICTAGLNFVVEGTTTDGSFIDLVTFSDWLVATMQQNVLSIFTNNKVVPYDQVGVGMLYGAVAQTLDAGVLSGALTETRADIDGNLLPAYLISIADISGVAPALQAQRIAPEIQYCARYAGAIHFVEVTGKILVAN